MTVNAHSSAEQSVAAAIEALQQDEPICIHDFDDREGETDLVYPATAVTPAAVRRLRSDAGGLICVALSDTVAETATLPYLSEAVDHPAVDGGTMDYGDRPSFSLTVNHRTTYTGITDRDRATTIQALGTFAMKTMTGDPSTESFADQFRSPGHVHLLRAAPGLLADRQGHTELAVQLAYAAELPPAMVVSEMLSADGGAMPAEQTKAYAAEHDIPFVTGEEILTVLG